jgi:transmembrane sensor
MTKSTQKLNAQILEEASAWFIDFNEEEVDQAGRGEFNAWLRTSPEHVRAFLQVSVFWEEAGTLSKRRDLDIDGLIARAKAEHNVYPLELSARDRGLDAGATVEEGMQARLTQRTARSRRKRLWFAVAASTLISLGVGTFAWYTGYPASIYATEIGELRSITLEDGSSVELNSRTRIKVHFTENERFVDLLEGQALFTVAKNQSRPFIVATGDTHVRAVGTQFDVYRKRSGTVVTVVEGRVAVAPQQPSGREALLSMMRESEEAAPPQVQRPPAAHEPTDVGDKVPPVHVKENAPAVGPGEVLLAAGEQLMITPAAIEPPKPANIAAATAWIDKRLVFESTPLREVVEEFNRYNRQQIVIRDPALNDFHISGVFPSTDSSRMVEFLRQRFGVTTNRSRDEIEIFRREHGDDSATLQRNVAAADNG